MEIAALYKYFVLDNIIELAYAVASDVVNRPSQYPVLDVAEELFELRYQYGFNEKNLTAQYRKAMYSPIFGDNVIPSSTNKISPFVEASKGLVTASTEYIRSNAAFSEDQRAQGVEASIQTLKSYISGLKGDTVKKEVKCIKAEFDNCKKILQSPNIASAFGVGTPPNSKWPDAADDTNGSKLIEAISQKLKPDLSPSVTQNRFNIQRQVAILGSDLIDLVDAYPSTDKDAKARLKDIVSKTYQWKSMLDQLSA